MELSKNFTLKELAKTSKPFPNKPTQGETLKLFYLCQYILQPIRSKFGRITVTSGFRSGKVNKAVGGSSTSQHRKGQAADIIPRQADIKTVYEWILGNLNYGQVILERTGSGKRIKRWIHVSLPRMGKLNKQALTFNDGKYALWEGATQA